MSTRAVQIDFLLAGLSSGGLPLAGGRVYTYEAGPGTGPAKTCWADKDMGSPYGAYIPLDANGSQLAFADGYYKFVIKDASLTTIYTWDDLEFLAPPISIADGGTGATTAADARAALGLQIYTPLLSPENFGAVGDGTANDTQAIADACAALVLQNGGTLVFTPGATYRIVPPTTPTYTSWITFTGINGIRFDGQGATIKVDYAFSLSGQNIWNCFNFLTCADVNILNLNWIGTQVTDPGTSGAEAAGYRCYNFNQTCQNINIEGANVLGANMFFGSGINSGEPQSYECMNIKVNNIVNISTFYPFSCQGGGRMIRIDNFRTINPGRSLFLRNVQDVKANVSSENNYADDILLKACNTGVGGASPYTSLEDIEINYRSFGRSRGSYGVACSLGFLSDGSGGGATARNIKLHMVMDGGTSLGLVPFRGMRFFNNTATYGDGTADTGAARGHVLDNFELSGTIINSFSSNHFIDFFTEENSAGIGLFPAGEYIKNVLFRDLVVLGANGDIGVGKKALVGHMVFFNVDVEHAINVFGTSSGTITSVSGTVKTGSGSPP